MAKRARGELSSRALRNRVSFWLWKKAITTRECERQHRRRNVITYCESSIVVSSCTKLTFAAMRVFWTIDDFIQSFVNHSILLFTSQRRVKFAANRFFNSRIQSKVNYFPKNLRGTHKRHSFVCAQRARVKKFVRAGQLFEWGKLCRYKKTSFADVRTFGEMEEAIFMTEEKRYFVRMSVAE